MRYTYLFLIGLLLSCTPEVISIENFDQEAWKSDTNGCQGDREIYADILMKNQDKLIGHNTHEIIQYLGKPDRNELYRRNQKIFHYHLSPGPSCDLEEHPAEHDRLVLRFNATDLLKEVSIYN